MVRFILTVAVLLMGSHFVEAAPKDKLIRTQMQADALGELVDESHEQMQAAVDAFGDISVTKSGDKDEDEDEEYEDEEGKRLGKGKKKSPAVPCDAIEGIENAAAEPCKADKLPSMCVPQCAEGFAPNVKKALRCKKGAWSPSTFECQQACTMPEETAKEFRCKAVLKEGQKCKPKCARGTEANIAELTCTGGVLKSSDGKTVDDLACAAQCSGSFETAYKDKKVKMCKDAWSSDGEACEVKCPAGWVESGTTAPVCKGDVWEPAEAPCKPKDCVVTNATGLSPKLVGTEVSHGKELAAACEAGYLGQAGACMFGKFRKPVPVKEEEEDEEEKEEEEEEAGDFVQRRSGKGSPNGALACKPMPCASPTGITDAAEVSCKGGTVKSGKACLPQCAEGFSAASPTRPYCKMGALSPASFECKPNCKVDTLTVKNAAEKPCKGIGANGVKEGAVCRAACSKGFKPSPQALVCQHGKFAPAAFECVPADGRPMEEGAELAEEEEDDDDDEDED